MKVTVGRNRVLVARKDQRGSYEKGMVNGEEMKEVNRLKYLGKLRRENTISPYVKRELYERVVIP